MSKLVKTYEHEFFCSKRSISVTKCIFIRPHLLLIRHVLFQLCMLQLIVDNGRHITIIKATPSSALQGQKLCNGLRVYAQQSSNIVCIRGFHANATPLNLIPCQILQLYSMPLLPSKDLFAMLWLLYLAEGADK